MNDSWDRNNEHSSSSSPPVTQPGRSSSNTSAKSRQRNSELRSLYEEQRELKQLLYNTTLKLQAETLRAATAEREVYQITNHLKRTNDARLEALQDAARANEELKLYKVQLDAAQREIFRAQDVLQVVDRQRYNAEKEAAEARTKAHKLSQEIVFQAAKEEGRRIGIQEGLERGRSIGFQEARMMGLYDLEEEEDLYDDVGDDFLNGYRPRSRYISSSEDSQRIDPPPPEPSPPPPTPPPRDPVPVPPPESTQPSPNVRPRSFRNASPSGRSHISIPPDGFIPSLDADHILRLPPPHELSRPPPTPERVTSPPLPHQDPIPIPPRTTRTPRQRQPSSPGSNSTALSQFDIVNDPGYVPERRSPLSAIAEVLSAQTSPNPMSMNGGHDLRHQSSWGASSRRSNATPGMPTPRNVTPGPGGAGQDPHPRQQAIYMRPRISSSSSGSNGSLNPPREARRFSSASTVPDINIEPPTADGTPKQENEYAPSGGYPSPNRMPKSSPSGPGSDSPSAGPSLIILHDNQLPQGFVPTGGDLPTFPHPVSQMPGGYQVPRSPSPSGPPVIPDPILFRRDNEEDISSSMSSADTLTTPPPTRSRHGHTRISSTDALMTPPPGRRHRPSASQSSWVSATQSAAAAVPLPASIANGTPRAGSEIYFNPSESGTYKNRPLSRSTNRSRV